MESLKERLELSHVFLPVSLIIIVSGYLELKLDELGLIRVDLIVKHTKILLQTCVVMHKWPSTDSYTIINIA